MTQAPALRRQHPQNTVFNSPINRMATGLNLLSLIASKKSSLLWRYENMIFFIFFLLTIIILIDIVTD